jgi:hypothetical protein
MRLIAIPIDHDILIDSGPHWLPFLPKIAQRTKETVATLIGRVMRKEVRLTLVWDDNANKAVALLGLTLHYRGQDLIAELIWLTGSGRLQWEHLISELEQLLREAGCVECRPICRPGWSRLLKRHGYKPTHIMMEKVL